MWTAYTLVHKRGATPLIDCPIWFLDCAEAELLAQAELARKKRERERSQEILKAHGLIK